VELDILKKASGPYCITVHAHCICSRRKKSFGIWSGYTRISLNLDSAYAMLAKEEEEERRLEDSKKEREREKEEIINTGSDT
jgi:hypothetical protein